MPDAGAAAYNQAKKAKIEHPKFSTAMLATITEQRTGRLFERAAEYVHRISQETILTNFRGGGYLAISEGAGEKFACELAKRLNTVRVAEIELTTDKPTDGGNFVRIVPGGYSLSKRIARAMPLYHLREKVKVSWIGEKFEQEMYQFILNKACPVAKEFYDDFPKRLSASIREAAKFDSAQRIRQYLYRALLFATYPHTSNSLVDADGRLWLIDNATLLYARDDADIRELHQYIASCDELMSAAAEFSILTERDIANALKTIPAPFFAGGILPNHQQATRYFSCRLNTWKQQLFKK